MKKSRRHVAAGVVLLSFVLVCLATGCESGHDSQQPSLLEKARKEYSIGQFTEAEKYYQDYLESTETEAGRWEAWSRLVDISLSVHGDYESGAQRLEIMILEFAEDSGRQLELLIRLAEVYEALREWDSANDAWQQALNVPDLEKERIPEIHWRLAKIHQYSGDYDLALDSLEHCLETSNDDNMIARCMFEKAQTLSHMKQTYQARRLLEQVVAMEGVDQEQMAVSKFMLADLLEQLNEFDKAEALLMSIRETYPNPLVVETRLEHLREVKESR